MLNEEKEIDLIRSWIKQYLPFLTKLIQIPPLRKQLHLLTFFKKAFYQGLAVLKQEGIAIFFIKLFKFTGSGAKRQVDNLLGYSYAKFLKSNELTTAEIAKIRETSKNFSYRPKISIIVPVYNVDPKWLDRCINSVIGQFYENWDLCIYDDASTSSATIQCLRGWEKRDERIKIRFGKENLNISRASNKAIESSTADYIGLLDHDDELTPNALYEVVKALNEDKSIDFLYSDEDKLDMDGTYCEPHFKSDFNIDLLLSNNYICHFSVIRKTIGDKIGWFREGYEGSQDYDLFLRIVDHTKNIHHIPRVLYHWRKIPGSTASVYSNKGYANTSSVNTLTEYLHRNEIQGTVSDGLWPGTFRIERKIDQQHLVSIIIPFKDNIDMLQKCISSLIELTDYKNFEVLLISNNSSNKETFEYTEELTTKHSNVKVYEYNSPFNYSELNNWAMEKAKGEYVLLLNDDTEVISGEWLGAMVEHIEREEVGGVGCTLLYPDHTIQHAGMVLGIGGVANHAFKHLPDGQYHFHLSMGVIRNVSGCTAACFLVKKELYKRVGGLDEKLSIAFNDVDLCLKIREEGYLIVYTPFAKLLHHESFSRGYEDTTEKQQRFESEVDYIKEKWGDTLEKDPYYNPNLTLEKQDYSLRRK